MSNQVDVYVSAAPVRIDVSAAQGPAGVVGPAGTPLVVSSTAPTNLSIGWLDPETGILAYYIGGAWVTQSKGGVSFPANAYTNSLGQPYTNTAGQYYLATV